MPDLKRVILASAAAVLLAAIAGGQQASPFRQPPVMPPELTPGNGTPPLAPPPRIHVELDNAELRVIRYRIQMGGFASLPDSSPGALIVALTALDLATSGGTVHLDAGNSRWIPHGFQMQNRAMRSCEFLVIQRKGN
jgi:hypothetical protein